MVGTRQPLRQTRGHEKAAGVHHRTPTRCYAGQRWQLVEAINDTGNRCNWAAAAFRTTSLLEVERVGFVVEPLQPTEL